MAKTPPKLDPKGATEKARHRKAEWAPPGSLPPVPITPHGVRRPDARDAIFEAQKDWMASTDRVGKPEKGPRKR